ncbi:MAG: hypothetical protein WBD67_05790 [Terracidiphilus sp.]
MSRSLAVRWVGLILYVVSYFLPAVRTVDFGTSNGGFLPGYFCAFISMVWGVAGFIPGVGLTAEGQRFFRMLLLPGLTNPLLLVYFCLPVSKRVARVRRWIGGLVLVCMAWSWIFFLVYRDYIPAVGHYLWVIGLVMIVGPDLLQALAERKGGVARSKEAVAPEQSE